MASWTYRYDEYGTALPSSTNLGTSPPIDAQIQVTGYETMTDQARKQSSWASPPYVILKNETEAYDHTWNAPHRTDRYPPPHRRHRAASARVWQQAVDALSRIEKDWPLVLHRKRQNPQMPNFLTKRSRNNERNRTTNMYNTKKKRYHW